MCQDPHIEGVGTIFGGEESERLWVGLVVEGGASAGFALAVFSLCLEAPFFGASAGFGRSPFPLGPQCSSQLVRHSLPRQFAVADLGPLVVGGSSEPRSKDSGQYVPLPGRQTLRLFDFEDQLSSGIGRVGMLPAGASRGSKFPSQFMVGNRQLIVHSKIAVGCHGP